MLFSESDIRVYISINIVYVLFKFITTPQVHFESFAFRLAPPTSLNSTLVAFMPASFLQLPQLTDHPGVACHVQIATAKC